MSYPTDGGVVLYSGSTLAGMVPLAYTMIGKSPDTPVSGNVIIQTTTPNSFVSVNAAAGNAAAIGIPPNTSTTNQSATTVLFMQIQ
ncbi:MAG: Collagen triple helix repeat protein [Candidatus Adlerbacteria bacterium]|nr:Collagen triple helix repeat protein [Candidatus Adlerbacteria bacterium]